MLTTDLDRRGTETVLGEHASHGTAGIERDQGQVAAVLLANLGLGDTKADTGHRQELIGGGRSVIDGHE